MEKEKWFKLKQYPHIGFPVTNFDYAWVKEYITDPEKIRVHSFLPLIHKCIKQRKYRPNPNRTDKTPTGKRFREKDEKKRDIYFASHLDSLIFSYYNNILVDAYEEYIKTKSFNNSIVAYRKIPVFEGSNNNKCNIEFAFSTFDFIKKNSDKNLSVIVADVTSFFDRLNHKILKKNWTVVLSVCKSLPSDHYNVFKALTNIKYVEGKQLHNTYKKTMIVKRGIPNSNIDTEYKRKYVEKFSYFKEKNAVAFCTKEEFLKNNLNLIISSSTGRGIPQGSPISATLANIYMLDFDQAINTLVESAHGYYQRYSDDLIIVCEQKEEDAIINSIRSYIAEEKIADLEIHPKKTKVYRFEFINGKFCGFLIDELTKQPNYNKPLEYLGFTFDGERVLIKNAGFSKYYRTVIKSFKKSSSLARNSKNPNKEIFKSRLYKKFTHKGSERRLIFRPSKEDSTKYVKTKKYDWGNYLSYVKKSDLVMQDLNEGNHIREQARKIWRNFHKLIETYK